MKARFEFKHDEEYNEYIRTYFAAMAMQGLCTQRGDTQFNINGLVHPETVAQNATIIADAIIKELNK